MAGFSTNKIFGLYIRESADDGSDFGTPGADYRFVYLGEDGNWHAKDASNVITTLGGGAGALDLSAMTIEHNVQGNSDYVAGYDASAADERGFPVYALHGGPQLSVIFDECYYRANNASPSTYAGGAHENASGTAAAASAGTPTSGHWGVIDLTTGTTTTGRCALLQVNPGDSMVLGGGIVRFDAVLKLSALSDGTNTYSARTGLGTLNAGDGDGVFLRYTHGTNSGKWQGVCRSGGVETTVDTGITADTSYHRLGFVVNAAGTSVQFRVDGADVGSPITTNIPTAATRMTAAGIVKSAGTTARVLSLDYYRLSTEFTTAR